MIFKRCSCLLAFSLLAMIGCATASDTASKSLTLQQSATIESLKAEVVRLNQELDGTVDSRVDLRVAIPELEKKLDPQIARGDVRIALDPRGLVVSVLDHALFDPDESQFTSAGEGILNEISVVLSKDLPLNRVSVEGHTDNQPIEGADGITNWEYSIGRASAVLHYFVDNRDLAPRRFGVAGYSEYKPIDSNATEEGRVRNRRVEIVIHPQKVSDPSGT